MGREAIEVAAWFDGAVLDMRYVEDGRYTTPVPVDVVPGGVFSLVREGRVLRFTAEMSGEVEAGGKMVTLAQLIAGGTFEWEIPDGGRARVCVGATTFQVSSVVPPERYAWPMRIDWHKETYTAMVALGAAVFLAGIYAIPPDPKTLSVDAFLAHHRFPAFLIKAQEEDAQLPAWLKQTGPATDARSAGRAGGQAAAN